MNKRRILVAADVTNGRDAAFERGLAIARTSGAELYILHAVPANQPFSVGATERLRRTAEFRNRAEQVGVTLQAVEQHGDPAEIIELHANARAVDLIVMGAERHRWPTWLRRSSLTERVLRRSKQPTLVVRNDDARMPTSKTCSLPLTCPPSPRRLSSRQSDWRVTTRRGSLSCTQ